MAEWQTRWSQKPVSQDMRVQLPPPAPSLTVNPKELTLWGKAKENRNNPLFIFFLFHIDVISKTYLFSQLLLDYPDAVRDIGVSLKVTPGP